jgi:hypothetical protein
VHFNLIKKVIFIVILFMIISLLNIVPSDQLLNQDHAAPGFHSTGNNLDLALIINEQRPNYLSSLKPIEIVFAKLKLRFWFELKTLTVRFATTQNLYFAMIILSLFSIYYQLSRTCSEPPGLYNVLVID